MPANEEKMLVTVRIMTATQVESFRIFIPAEKINSEEHCRKVISAGIEMSCALLDAPYTKELTE